MARMWRGRGGNTIFLTGAKMTVNRDNRQLYQLSRQPLTTVSTIVIGMLTTEFPVEKC